MKRKLFISAKKLALIAVMTATLNAGKLALMAIPNVEVVTILCALYGYCFGWMGLIATSLFVLIETFIFGMGSWVLSYIIHWNVVCLIFWLLKRFKVNNIVIITLIAVVLTTCFGVLSSLIDVGLFSGIKGDFWAKFAIYYTRGAVFYITQIVTNLIVFPCLFPILSKTFEKLNNKYFRT